MANVLTDLAADIYTAADIVGRELVGFIPASTINANGIEAAAVGQTVRSFATRQATAVDIAPSMTIPEGTDQTVDNKTLTLTEQRGVQIPYTGEDVRFLNGGARCNSWCLSGWCLDGCHIAQSTGHWQLLDLVLTHVQ